tara:strand:+ start:1230 stop:2114 length:885 start_codon:yes stop_codon:yes gene_type:complete
MIKKGIYSATCSILNNDLSLNIDATINHAVDCIKNGLHGAIFFGSTGQSQLIDLNSKKNLISKIAKHKSRKHFYLGTGCNSLNETIDLIRYAYEYDFNDFLIMPPAYYKGNTEQGVYEFYKIIIKKIPKVRIILYNFEKLSSFLFTPEFVKKLVKDFPKNIIGVKDSSYNLYENLKIKNFLIFPGSEKLLLESLKSGCSGIISATTQVTHSIARKVFDDYEQNNSQTENEALISIRKTFDNFNLISALHSYFSKKNDFFKNLLPPLETLNEIELKDLYKQLNKLNFDINKNLAA